AIGVLFTAAFALGIFLMSRLPRSGVDLGNYLFGDILAVGPGDLIYVVGLGIAVAIVVAALWRPLLYASFDPVVAQAAGIRVWFSDYALLVVLAVTIIVSVQLVGIVLVAALLVTPAAAAALLTKRFVPMMLLAGAFGIVSSVGGLYASWWLRASSGATIVLSATLLFFAALATSDARRRPALPQRSDRGALLQRPDAGRGVEPRAHRAAVVLQVDASLHHRRRARDDPFEVLRQRRPARAQVVVDPAPVVLALHVAERRRRRLVEHVEIAGGQQAVLGGDEAVDRGELGADERRALARSAHAAQTVAVPVHAQMP